MKYRTGFVLECSHNDIIQKLIAKNKIRSFKYTLLPLEIPEKFVMMYIERIRDENKRNKKLHGK